MLDGAEEAPTVNELYEAIELDETTLFNDAVTCAILRANRIIRDLQDEVDWLNAELHGAELEAARAERTCEDMSGGDPCVFACSYCGAMFDHPEHERVYYCPSCGAKVVEE